MRTLPKRKIRNSLFKQYKLLGSIMFRYSATIVYLNVLRRNK